MSRFAYGNTRPRSHRFESSCGSLPSPTPAQIAAAFDDLSHCKHDEAGEFVMCLDCGLGPCPRRDVPNRLYGTTINSEGDAV